MRSRSFGKYITNISDMREAVSFFASAVGEVLRSENCVANHIGVFFNTNRFNKDEKFFGSRGTRLPEPTASSQILIGHALELLGREWKDGYRYNKAGVVATGITRAKSLQLELGHSERIERGLRAITTVDTLNSKYHHNLISLASQGTGFNWRAKQENLSSAPQEYIRPTQRYRFMPYVPMSVGKSVL
jgi:DNA polymerase V